MKCNGYFYFDARSGSMKFKWLFLVCLALSHAKSKARRENAPRHVDLALETALVFDPKDSQFDITLIRTLRGYLDQLQDMILRRNNFEARAIEPRVTDNTTRVYSFRELLTDLRGYILKYSDEEVKKLAIALNAIFEGYYPAGSAFHKIIFDPRLKNFIRNMLKDWAQTDPKELKHDLKSLEGNDVYNNTFINLLNVVTGFFDAEDSKKLKKLGKKLRKFPETPAKLNKVLRKLISFTIFERYDSLTFREKYQLADQLALVAMYVTQRFKNKALDPNTIFVRAHEDEVNGVREKPLNESKHSAVTRTTRDDGLVKLAKAEKVKKPLNHEIVLNKTIRIMVNKPEINETSGNTTPLDVWHSLTELNITENDLNPLDNAKLK